MAKILGGKSPPKAIESKEEKQAKMRAAEERAKLEAEATQNESARMAGLRSTASDLGSEYALGTNPFWKKNA